MGGHIWTPSSAALEELLGRIAPELDEVLVDSAIAYGELTLTVEPAAIARVLTFLRDEPGLLLNELVDLCGVDYPPRERRFDVVYHLLSVRHNLRVRVKVETDEATPVPSVIGVFPTAGWFEREAFPERVDRLTAGCHGRRQSRRGVDRGPTADASSARGNTIVAGGNRCAS